LIDDRSATGAGQPSFGSLAAHASHPFGRCKQTPQAQSAATQ
jgi:hypothetical protein